MPVALRHLHCLRLVVLGRAVRRQYYLQRTQFGCAPALFAAPAARCPKERGAIESCSPCLQKVPARVCSRFGPSVCPLLLPSLSEQPLVVWIVPDFPLAYRSSHNVEVVEVVARRRRDGVIAAGHEHG